MAGKRLPDPGPLTPPGSLWEVAVALPLFHTLTYRLGPALSGSAQVGSLVRVPVGRQQVTGFILGPGTAPPGVKIKEIQAVLDPVPRFGPELVPLCRWLADYYQYPLGEALSHIIPGGAHPTGPRYETLAIPLIAAAAPLPSRLGPRGRVLLEYLLKTGPLPVKEVERLFPGCRPVLQRLATRALLSLEKTPRWRDPLADQTSAPAEPPLTLAPEQRVAQEAIVQGLGSGAFAPFLLHGVTASGKTEVYLAGAAESLARGRQVLVLLPEIALTHPVAQAFRRRFGHRVTVLHSGLSEASRLDQWRRMVLGEVDIVVGARSAVFAPLPRLGLIVVDEEHDPSYKHEGGLPYQARDVALYRGKLAGAAVVLVSATPQVTTYYQARQGKYRYLNLTRRVTPQSLPDVHLVDLREQRGDPGLKIISRPLREALNQVLSRGEQALLFLNRRGYAAAHFCLFCGEVFQCRQCSVALTHHRREDRLICHYCGYSTPVPEVCPHCQSTAIKRYGVGTEKVEAEVRKLWPDARVARLDRDTAPHSGRALKVLESFAAGDLDILVGTQMITKGHHFPRVTLVGVIAADLSLFFPEYHSGERTFQLLAQVTGRAGRGETKGQALIQTYHPEHYVFQAVQAQDYQGFAGRELESRRQWAYPPFTRLALLRLSGADEAIVTREAHRLARYLKATLTREQGSWGCHLQVLGPAPATLRKLQGRFRWQILLKSYGRDPLKRLLSLLRQDGTPPTRSGFSLTLDVDPVNLL
jgi:primosomal protein N' (replication factor Y) (superfamily II helicase)